MSDNAGLYKHTVFQNYKQTPESRKWKWWIKSLAFDIITNEMYDQYDLENSDWHESDMKAKIVIFRNLFNLNGLILDKRFPLFFFPINHKTISGDRSSILMLRINVAKTFKQFEVTGGFWQISISYRLNSWCYLDIGWYIQQLSD